MRAPSLPSMKYSDRLEDAARKGGNSAIRMTLLSPTLKLSRLPEMNKFETVWLTVEPTTSEIRTVGVLQGTEKAEMESFRPDNPNDVVATAFNFQKKNEGNFDVPTMEKMMTAVKANLRAPRTGTWEEFGVR